MELKIGVMTEKAKKAWSYFIIHASPLAQQYHIYIFYEQEWHASVMGLSHEFAPLIVCFTLTQSYRDRYSDFKN